MIGGVHPIYISRKHKIGVGVRRDGVEHMILPETTKRILTFSRPCLCGSLTHVSTRNYMCSLNKQYMDD